MPNGQIRNSQVKDKYAAQVIETAKRAEDAHSTMTNAIPNLDEAMNSMRKVVADFTADSRPIRVLEAGCGSGSRVNWLFQLKSNAFIVGVDASQEALDENTVVNEKILADIQNYRFRPRDFDLIICYDVLEHLPSPEKAVANFADAINHGGLIVLASPVTHSLKGLITKFTPHWFHVLVYRHLLGHKDAGKPGCLPFPTYLRWSISPKSLLRFAKDRGLIVEHVCLYNGMYGEGPWDSVLNRNKVMAVGSRLLEKLVEIFSFGRIHAGITDFVIVFRQPNE
jgi:2-polyprenyl-3-methyl-5-hydroxy-6-metoxy-1,4-benzoquinol methylase